MCLFAGLTLRESAKITGTSHEYIRLALLKIKSKNPELHKILYQSKTLIESLIPIGSQYKWKVLKKETGKTYFFNNLKAFCKKNKIDPVKTYNTIVYHKSYDDKKLKIERNTRSKNEQNN